VSGRIEEKETRSPVSERKKSARRGKKNKVLLNEALTRHCASLREVKKVKAVLNQTEKKRRGLLTEEGNAKESWKTNFPKLLDPKVWGEMWGKKKKP